MENKDTKNNTPAPWYFKYIFLGVVIITFILLFWGIKSKIPVNKNSTEETSEINEEITTIEIKDLSKYEGCLIWNNEAYFLFDNVLLDRSFLNAKLGVTNSSFNTNKDETYKAINGAVYEYLEGMEFYSIKNNTNDIAVDCDNELGFLIFTKDLEKYKKNYEDFLTFKHNKKIYLYTDIINENYSSFTELSINTFKETKEIDYITDMSAYNIFLLTINDNNYLYSYMFLYDDVNKKAFIQNQLEKKTLEISFNLGEFDENN